MDARTAIDAWVADGFQEPSDESKHYFYLSTAYLDLSPARWTPTEDAIIEYKANPVRETELQVSGHTVYTCSGYNCILLELPDGEWVSSHSDGIWIEYDSWVVCWENTDQGVAHIFQLPPHALQPVELDLEVTAQEAQAYFDAIDDAIALEEVAS